MEMIALIPITMIIMVGLAYMQKKNHEHYERCRYKDAVVKIDEALAKRLEEFDEYKKRVDALTLKAGFKL